MPLIRLCALLQEGSTAANRVKGVAQIVPQNRDEAVAILRCPVDVAGEHLGDQLIDGIVEPYQFSDFSAGRGGHAALPQTQDACPKAAIFGDHLLEIEA